MNKLSTFLFRLNIILIVFVYLLYINNMTLYSTNTAIKELNIRLKSNISMKDTKISNLGIHNISLLKTEMEKLPDSGNLNLIRLKQLNHKIKLITENTNLIDSSEYKDTETLYNNKLNLIIRNNKQKSLDSTNLLANIFRLNKKNNSINNTTNISKSTITNEQDDLYNENVKSNIILKNNEVDIIDITKDKNIDNLNNKNFLTYQQNAHENTCVIDSIGLILKKTNNIDINKTYIYNKIGKNIGDYWLTGEFLNYPSGGKFNETDERMDFKKMENNIPGFSYSYVSRFSDVRTIIEKGTPVLFQGPMSLFDKNTKWLNPENKSVWHAVSVYGIDDNYIYYSNTLTGKLEKMYISKILTDKGNIRYPVVTMNIDISKFDKNAINKNLAFNK